MASIQQSMNQMLQTAQFGASVYAHSPVAKEKADVKQSKAFADTSEAKLKDLAEQAQGAGEITPEIEKATEDVLAGRSAAYKRLAQSDPAYMENWVSSLQDEEMLKTQGRLGIKEWQGVTSLKARQETRQNQKAEFEKRKSIILDKTGKPMEVLKNGK